MHGAPNPRGLLTGPLQACGARAVTIVVSHALRPVLSRFPLFGELNDEELGDLARAIRPETLAAGAELFRQGDAGDAAYLVERGRLRVTAEVDGQAVCVTHVEAGDVVGELALVDGGARSATVVATRACQLLRLDAGEFDYLRRNYRSAAFTLLRGLAGTLAARQRATNEHIGRLLGGHAPGAAAEPDEEPGGLLARLAFWRRR